MRNSAFSRLFWWLLRALPLIVYVAMLFSSKYVRTPVADTQTRVPSEQVLAFGSAPALFEAFVAMGIDDMGLFDLENDIFANIGMPSMSGLDLYIWWLIYVEVAKLIVTVLTFIPKWANNMAERYSS